VKKENTGPLAAMSLDPNSNSWNNQAMGIPLDATYLYVNALLQFEDGKPATASAGIYNHHLAYVSTKKFASQFMTCPGKDIKMKTPATFMGATEEANYSIYTTNDYKFDSGFYLAADDKIVVTGEIVNYNNETKNVFAVSELEYLPGRVKAFKDVVTQILLVNQCDGNQLGLQAPKDKKVYSVDSQNMTAIQDGFLLNGRRFENSCLISHKLISGQALICMTVAPASPCMSTERWHAIRMLFMEELQVLVKAKTVRFGRR
jgi:hypothetical protein